ncbi:cytoplasmic protein [Chrysochromulina tobinii]|uniref:Cytoplasmic protein n=1 Tax=Chrysochromulina tobinii TaxID=1460289 RepID=A0A0M0JQA4_9EUKA|nr:cytoplasmic protein [Chrysochromulina tobinii]|eukprot:KOO28452.1 cytoplasmic protein [Chrysochromulina sp. CCMP291]
MEPERRAKLRGVLARGLVALADRLGVSSVHVTFSSREDGRALKQEGFLPRLGVQFHWCNGNYSSFDDYLASLKQSRRKAVERKWGHDYLKRPFFDALGEQMPESVVLVLAEDAEGELVAGALNLIGEDCVYGRNWGCNKWHDALHFEGVHIDGQRLVVDEHP